MSNAQAADRDVTLPEAGAVVGRYKLLERLGAGGMGVVFEAEDTTLRRRVALKFLHAEVARDAKRRRRFLREGKLAAQLTHPCIAAVYEAGEEGNLLYIAMELVRGRKLSELVSKERPLTVGDSVRIVREVARGLSKAHDVGIIHRDLKPDNVMIGEDGIVKILDFGVAKVISGSDSDFTGVQTHAGSLVGTPAYMSPEQAAGRDTDGRSDLFSLGVLLYELCTGHQPFRGGTWQETIISINRDKVEPASKLRASVPEELDRILGRCLAKKPDDRYPTCRDLVLDLNQLVASHTTMHEPSEIPALLSVAPVTTVESLPPPNSLASFGRTMAPAARQRTTMIVAGAVAAVLVAGIGLLLGGTGSGTAPSIAGSVPVETPGPNAAAPSTPLASAPGVEPSAPSVEPSAPAAPSASAAAKAPRRRTVAASSAHATAVAPPPPVPVQSAKARPKNPVLGF